MITNKFAYTNLKRVTLETGERYYVCPTSGAAVPSVTTIISATSSKKEFLEEWEARVGKRNADRTRDEAVALGSLVHTNVENYLAGIERPRGNHLLRKQAYVMADQIIEKAVKPHVSEVFGMEIGLCYPGLYAGTTDLVGIYKGKLAIMDHKTAKVMRTRDMILDYFDQLAAYAIAHDEIYGTEIEMGVIFMVDRNLDFQMFEIDEAVLGSCKDSFLRRTERYYETAKIPDISGRNATHLG